MYFTEQTQKKQKSFLIRSSVTVNNYVFHGTNAKKQKSFLIRRSVTVNSYTISRNERKKTENFFNSEQCYDKKLYHLTD